MPRKGSCLCPSCGKDLAPKSIHEHTKNCSKWIQQFGEPWPYFKYSMSPKLFQPELVEGVDYVRCYECLQRGWDFRFLRLIDHIHIHGMTEESYAIKYASKSIRLASTHERRKATVNELYGVDNVFQAESIKSKSRESVLARFGVENPNQSPEVQAKSARTNLARYGAENPFGSELIKARIKNTIFQKYGVEFVTRSPEVRAKTEATSMARYGETTYLRTEAFKAQLKETSLKRYGFDHPMKSLEGKQKWMVGCIAAFGVPNPLLVPRIHLKSQETTKANHGGVHHFADPAFVEKRKQALLAQYGVDNVSKIPAIKEKIIRILKEKWGCGAVPKMNNLERAVAELLPERIVYSGDWTYWTTWANGRHKNPDFVVLTPEQLVAYKAGVPLNDLRTYLVIEVNGTFWHTKHKGLTRAVREKEFVDGYASIGITCLVLWEGDFREDPRSIEPKVDSLLASTKPARAKSPNPSIESSSCTPHDPATHSN
jgi:hypothetical protein